jgi:hypothetical protein
MRGQEGEAMGRKIQVKKKLGEETKGKGNTSFSNKPYVEEKLVARKQIKHTWMTWALAITIQSWR